MDTDELSRRARLLRNLVEPLAANVYFAPEAHEAYAALGFSPSPGNAGLLALPDGPAYFTSRGACMGQVPGEVVAAAFGVFNPASVVPAVTHGWSLTGPDEILAARQQGAVSSLTRILGPRPEGLERATKLLRQGAEAASGEGRHLFSGLRSLGWPEDGGMGDLWRAADLVREHRGDTHIAAWVSHGFGAAEISLLTELWWGLGPRTYSRTRAWTSAELDAALERLRTDGLAEGDLITDEGRRQREAVERATDLGERSIVVALEDELEELAAILGPWGQAVVDSGGYPAAAGAMVRGSSTTKTAS